MNLAVRISRLETKSPNDRRPRVIRMVASDEEEALAAAQLRVEGFDPDGDDILIIRLIAVSGPNGPARREIPARILGVSEIEQCKH